MVGYAQGHANSPNEPAVIIFMDNVSLGEHKLMSDESFVNRGTGVFDPQSFALRCKISDGRAGQRIHVKFISGGQQNHGYTKQQATGARIDQRATIAITTC